MTQVDLFYDEIKFIPGDLYFLRLGVFGLPLSLEREKKEVKPVY